MWPVIIGAGAVALYKLFSKEEESGRKPKKRIFISFAMKDEKYRNYFVRQSKKETSPFSFIDMSVKKPWSEEIWKQKCRTKIKSCHGVIVLLSRNTWHSAGVRWEVKCAREENVPIIGMHIKKNDKKAIPPELRGKIIIDWKWNNITAVINKF